MWRCLYVLPSMLATLSMLTVAAMAWRYRSKRGGVYLTVFAIGAAIWSFFEGLSFTGWSTEEAYFIWKLEYIGVAIVPAALTLFVIDYVGYGHLITRRRLLALCIFPVIMLIAAGSNEWHEWIDSKIAMDFTTPIPTLSTTPGPLLWLYFAYSNLLILTTVGSFIRRMAELRPLQKRQVQLALIAFSFPLIGSALYMLDMTPVRNMSLPPLAFNFAGLFLIRGFMRERMFELAPVTVHEIYLSLEDPIFVLDDMNRILDFNQAALMLLSLPDTELIGQSLPDLLPNTKRLLKDENSERRGEVAINDDLYYDVRVTSLNRSDKYFSARLLVWRDITERKRLEADLYRLANTDSLTGLNNRRCFLTRGEEEINRAQRYKRPLSLVMIDIDYFKNVNDSYGHETGDRVLQMLACILNKELRTTDSIGRIGGEEFALLLTETGFSAAHDVALRVLDSIRQARVLLDDGNAIGFTVSAGVAALGPNDEDFNALLRRADDALYLAKNEGRDRLMPCRISSTQDDLSLMR